MKPSGRCGSALFFVGMSVRAGVRLVGKDRLYSGLGILIGMLLAMAGIWHMWKVLDTALELGDGAQKYATSKNLLRYCGGFSRVCSPDADTFCRPVSGVCGFDGNESFGLSAAFYTRIQRKEEEVRR